MKFSVNVFGENTVEELESYAKIAVGCTIRIQINEVDHKPLYEFLRIRDLINRQVDTVRSCAIKGDELVFEIDFGQMNNLETLVDIWVEWKNQCERFRKFFLENLILLNWQLELNLSPTSELLEDE